MKDLGYMNGWAETPQIVKDCECEERDSKEVRNCLRKYWCEKCGYYYHVDSSD